MPIGWFSKGVQTAVPNNLWTKCAACEATVYNKDLEKAFFVCPECGHHLRLPANNRIELLADEDSWEEFSADLLTADPLQFVANSAYPDRIARARERTGANEAIKVGTCRLDGIAIVLGVMDFSFVGGSMGSVVGEKIARASEKALENRCPLILVTSSGGARMDEGILSLMQMVKTGQAIAELAKERLPYVSILADPTTGGVTASFAMLGDVIMAEPGALIGFAGPRVIEQTIRQTLPEGFQRSEFLLEKGAIDMIVERGESKAVLAEILRWFQV
jgi:acetyl-CoA carboxylase carboxyl transferase subunit beta